MSASKRKFEQGYTTKAIRGGHNFRQCYNLETNPSIVTATTFFQADPTSSIGYTYARSGNPTRSTLEKCIADLDGGEFCLTFPSGCTASCGLLQLLKRGDHILCCLELYGGTRSLFLHYAEQQGIEIDFVNMVDASSVEPAIKSNTKLVWIETPANPCLKVYDIQTISKMAHDKNKNIMVAVDNTVLTSYFQRPLSLGADIVMYSLTKYMNGHSDVLMGALVMNDETIYDQLRANHIKYGWMPAPFDCYMVIRSLKTLSLRMDRHSANGLAVAQFLESHPKVIKVHHPGLLSHPGYELFKKQSKGYSGLLSFQIEGTVNEAKKCIQNFRVFTSCGSLGTCDSLVMLPVFVSHAGVPSEVLNELEIFDTTIRLSVGLENIEDLIEDLKFALDAAYE